MRASRWWILLMAMMVLGCRHTPDEQQIRDAIAATATAAEAGEASRVGDVLTADFDGNGGVIDRTTLVNMLRAVALRGGHVGVTIGPVTVEARSGRYVARFHVTLTSTTNVLPDDLGIYAVETAWRKEGSAWLCYSATWGH